MNYEVVDYDENLPIKVFIAKLNNFQLHWHDELEIVHVMEGKVKLRISENTYFLQEGDMALISFREIHQIQSIESECVLQIIQINPKFMEYHFPYLSRIRFQKNLPDISKEINSCIILNLKKLISEIINSLVDKKLGYEYEVISFTYKLFGILIGNLPYIINSEDESEENNIVFKRLTIIFEYIEKNYMNEINNETLAEVLHLSRYYLAHFFKEHTGLSMGQYITNIRMNKATELLVRSEESITNIILSCGFKNIKYFYKVFKEVYKCSPLKYRNDKKQENNNKKVHQSDLIKGYIYYADKFKGELVQKELKSKDTEISNNCIPEGENIRTICICVNDIKGKHNKYASFSVGAGRAGEVLRKDFDSQLAIISRECGFKYLRFHGIFHDELAVYSEDSEGNAIYNWQYTDKVYDNILEKGMKPFVGLGLMPEALASGNHTVLWWKANITHPKDYNKWYKFINNFVLHLEDRYGRDEILTWYFEVWNEPNFWGFFDSDMKEYFKLYDYTVKAVKDVCTGYRVGGPASAGNGWINDIIDHCSASGTPIDFISTHTYGMEGFFDEFGNYVIQLGDKDEIINSVKAVKEKVMKSSMPHLEIHYTEWSSCCSNRDPIHDSYIEAPYILHTLKNLDGVADSMSYWAFTDIFEEEGPPPTPFHGGFGLINAQSLKKAAYFSYKFIHELGEYELNNIDTASWVCKDENEIQALFWDLTLPKQDADSRKFFNRDMPSKEKELVVFVARGLLEGRYRLELYRVGYGSNDVYTDYIKMSSPRNLSREQVKELYERNSGKPFSVEEVEIDESHEFNYSIDMRENDICFLKLKML